MHLVAIVWRFPPRLGSCPGPSADQVVCRRNARTRLGVVNGTLADDLQRRTQHQRQTKLSPIIIGEYAIAWPYYCPQRGRLPAGWSLATSLSSRRSIQRSTSTMERPSRAAANRATATY